MAVPEFSIPLFGANVEAMRAQIQAVIDACQEALKQLDEIGEFKVEFVPGGQYIRAERPETPDVAPAAIEDPVL